MTRSVPFSVATGYTSLEPIRAGWPVAAQPLRIAAQNVNWLLGRGVPLVVDGGHRWEGDGSGGTRTLNYRYEVDAQHHGMVMTIVVSVDGQFPVTIGGTEYIVGERPQIIYRPFPNLSGDAEISWAFTTSWSQPDSDVYVHSLSLIESPQNILDGGVEGIEPRSPVYDGYGNRESIAGLARAVEEARGYFRRGTLFNWAVGVADGYNTDETSFQAFFVLAPAIQNRLMYANEATRNVKVNVFARVDSGSTGEVKVEIVNGVSTVDVTFTVTSTSDTWHTTQTIAVATDQADRWDIDGGLRGGDRSPVQIYARVTGASQRVYVLAVSIWDPPG